MSATLAPTAPSDFDFILGDWDVRHRRLDSRLTGCTTWSEFSGTSSTRKIMDGFGNVEDNVLQLPDGDVYAAAFRSFDPAAGSWAIWWLDHRVAHHLDVPVVGGFDDGIGTFYAHDTLDGRPISIRFIWNPNAGGNPRWQQSFSADAGATWETNWTMEFVRRET